MQVTDDELVNFEANGAAPLPASGREGFVENDGGASGMPPMVPAPPSSCSTAGSATPGTGATRFRPLSRPVGQSSPSTVVGMVAARATPSPSATNGWQGMCWP
jgi:hypothetical protein